MAIKKTKRKGFNFLRSYFDVVNELEKDKDKLDFLIAVINKQFLDENPKGLNFVANLCYTSQRHQIETSVKGYKDKTNTNLDGSPLNTATNTPTEPPYGGVNEPPTEPPCLQEEEKGEEQEKEKEKDILQRKGRFEKSLIPFLSDYNKVLIREFADYWTEHTPKGKKMRHELSKNQPFNTKLRLVRWKKGNAPKKEDERVSIKNIKYGTNG